MALEHQGEHAPLIRRRLAHGHGAGDISGAVQILATAVHQQQTALLHPADGAGDRLVVRQGAVRAAAGDGVERQVLQRPGGLAEAFQCLGNLALVRQGRLPHRIHPVQEAGQGRAVADMGLTRPLDLDRILAGPRQGAGVHAAHHGRAGRLQPVKIPGRRLARIDQHLLARQGVQRGVERGRGLQRHGIAQPAGQFIGHLARIKEQLRRAVRPHHSLSQRQGGADHVTAADVEQPGQRRRGRQHGGLRARPGDGLADARAFGGAGLAAVAVLVRHHRGGRLLRALFGPGQVERVRIDRPQLGPGLRSRTLQRGERVRAVQAGVIADDRTGWSALQIGGHTTVHEIEDLELRRIDLGPDLNGVASIGEHRRPILHHHARTGRAGEAAQPGQPVVGGRQILVLVFVLMRDQQAVEPLLGHLRANARQVFRPEGRISGFIEGLAHGGETSAPPPCRKPSVLRCRRRDHRQAAARHRDRHLPLDDHRHRSPRFSRAGLTGGADSVGL